MALPVISITQAAKQQIDNLLAQDRGKIGLLFSIKKGGCAGMEYNFTLLDEKPQAADEIELEGIKFYIPRSALLFLLGTEIDYEVTALRSGFIFHNPNQLSACGCGASVLLAPAQNPEFIS